MSTFYIPFKATILNIPVIIYPMKILKDVLDPSRPKALENHLTKLYRQKPNLHSGTYHIAILWAQDSQIMTDIWIYRNLESEETGYTIDCMTFKGSNLYKSEGITASDGLIMLGRETELEELMRKQGYSIDDYINGQRPVLPGKLETQVYWYR